MVARTDGAPIAQEIHSPFDLWLPTGPIRLEFFEFSPTGVAQMTAETVQVQAGVNTMFTTTVINQVTDPTDGPAAPPTIDSAQVSVIDGKVVLTLTGSRFTYDVNDPSAPNDGTAIIDLVVNFDVPMRPGQRSSQDELGRMIVAGEEIPRTFRVTATPDPLTSNDNAIHVTVPKDVMLGVSDLSVTRKTPVLTGTTPKTWVIADRTSTPTRLDINLHILFAASTVEGNVTAIDTRTNEIISRIPVGDQLGAGPRSVAVTPDLTRAYVTLLSGQGVAVIDTYTLQAADFNPDPMKEQTRIDLPGSRPYWAVADKDGRYLYVSDQNVGLIYVIDILPTSPTYHTVVKQISVPSAPEGLRGMDLTADGRHLYVAAPVKGGAAAFSKENYPDGKILVIDTDLKDGNIKRWTVVAQQTVSQEPYFVKASPIDSRLVTFTNRRSDANGFGLIRATNDGHTSLSVTYAAMTLGSRLDTFDVNDASAIAILPAGTLPDRTLPDGRIATQEKDYAFVTGWNRILMDDSSRDPYLTERLTLDERLASGYILRTSVGGNIGVIEDPFGTPKLVAATSGQFMGIPDGLTLSADGKTLYAAFSGDNAVRVFDVQLLYNTLTAPENQGGAIIRRDGVFTTLETTPLAGPDVPGDHIYHPINPAIQLAPIGTGRFPQGLAIADKLPVTIGFGREDDAVSTAILPDAEQGDTTPVFRWAVDWADEAIRNRATSRLYLSTFRPGQGLFPTDLEGTPEFPEKDLARHRILNGVEATHRFTQEGDVFEYDLELEQGELRALTLGQTYYIGVKIYDGGGNVIAAASRAFTLEQAPAMTPFSSVTILTHGFQPSFNSAGYLGDFIGVSEIPKVFFELGDHIAEAGGGGLVAKYDKLDGKWIIKGPEGKVLDVTSVTEFQGKSLVLIPDWITESSISDSGFSEATADAIFASLIQLNRNLNGALFASPLHFIGLSRGAVVNSEIIQRLGTYFPNVPVQQTTLDPHDFNQPSLDLPADVLIKAAGGLVIGGIGGALVGAGEAFVGYVLEQIAKSIPIMTSLTDLKFDLQTISYGDFKDPDVQRWENVSFADNYFQQLGNDSLTFTPNGRAIDGFDINVSLSGAAPFSDGLARAGFTKDDLGIPGVAPSIFGLAGPHSRVWRWYAGTVDLTIEEFSSTASGDAEPIFRSLADRNLAPFNGTDIPWYVPNGFASTAQDAPWEGIGAGWFYSPQGGAGPSSIIQGVPISFNNTEVPIGLDPAVPTVFNGNFEYGNLHGLARYPGLFTRDALSTPGWSFHGGSFEAASRKVAIKKDGAGNYAVELSRIDNPTIIHNRFYIAPTAEYLQFNYSVQGIEFGRDSNSMLAPRQPDLDVYIKVGGQEYPLGKVSSTLTVQQAPPSGAADYRTSKEMPLVLRQNPLDPTSAIVKDLRGEVGELIFRLTVPEGQPAWETGQAKVWLDNIRLGPTGVALQTEVIGVATERDAQLSESGIVESLAVAQRYWTSLIQTPRGGGGIDLGGRLVLAEDLSIIPEQGPDRGFQLNGDAGFGQLHLDNQGFLTHVSSRTEVAWPNQVTGILGAGVSSSLSAGQVGINDNTPCAADGHAIDAQSDAFLCPAQVSIVVDAGIWHGIEPIVVERGALEDDGAIGIANIQDGFDTAIVRCDRSITDDHVFDLEEISLAGLKVIPSIQGHAHESIGFGLEFTTSLGQSDNQQNPDALQHHLSFGSPTLPPDRKSVNSSDGLPGLSSAESTDNSVLSPQPSVLSAEQFDLLSRATIAIDDLPDGYLALTLGTTITLDIDAAGYGWFIDQTPFFSEEFTSPLTPDSSPWQLQAAPGSAADGHIDLLTVLMHELGHVMGLGHVSSAVDGTRLMAGSIDPGIRRLSSSLDLGPIDSDSNHSPDTSPLTPNQSQAWAPYMAHYTLANSHQLSASNSSNLTSALTSTLWAAQLPSHEGVFNSNFANTDQSSADYGWDISGAVTIANGQAVLSEDSTVISTLSQLFTLPSGASHLRFTLLDVNLTPNASPLTPHPPDAFEVALLEASTMTPLAGVVDGLTQTDSLLNIQADGTIYTSPLVTVTPLNSALSPQSSALLVDVDLTGLPVGTAARLSFDLLGFGARTSTVTIDNVLLTDGTPTAAPVAVDDSYSLAEGGSVLSPQSSGLLSNDSDPDSPPVSLSALLVTGPSHGLLNLNADGSFTYVHDGGESLSDTFTYQVSDGINLSNLATVSFAITPVNDAPVLAPIPTQSVEQAHTLQFTVVATDPDDSNLSPESSVLTFSLGAGAPAEATIDPTTGLFTWSVPRTQPIGFYAITVHVTDAGTPALTASQTFTVEVLELTNTPPTLNPIGNKIVDEETPLSFTVSATDLDLPAQLLTFSTLGLPDGATFNFSTGIFTWTPSETQGGADYVVTFSVSDGEFSDSETITIAVNEVNVAPVLAPIGNKSVNEETELRFTISGSDVDDPVQPLTYSATGLPLGATFNPLTREFVWTPTENQGPGSYAVTFSVTDGVVTTSELVTISVNEVNVAPVLAPIGNKTVNEGELLTFTVSATDVDDPTQLLTYSASGLPPGATFDAATGLFAWTPTDGPGASPYPVTIQVSDGVVTTSETIAITVANVAPEVTFTPFTQAVQYSDPIVPIVITATDVMTDTLNVTTAWSTDGTAFTAGLPDALTLTGGLALTGTANQVGTASWTISEIADLDPAQVYTIRITVTDEDDGITVQEVVIHPVSEDVQATYIGPLLLSTADIDTSTATVPLRVTIQDISAILPGEDPDAGVVTQSTVTFINRDSNTIIAEQVPVAVLDPGDPTTGVADYDWTVDLGKQDAESYTIGMIVDGFYRRDSAQDNTVVTVSKPLQNFITGGGYLLNQSSAGLYAGDQGEKTNFGFNVKFNKQLTNIQGKINLIIRQQGHVYQIRTNSTDSLVVQDVDPLTHQAVITAKANLKDITDPLNPITLGGNLDLIATVTDRGEPGTNDTVAFMLWKQNQLWYASAWNGAQTVEQVLAGGNIQAHTNPQALMLDEASQDLQTSITEPVTLRQTAPLVNAAEAQWIRSGLVPDTDGLVTVEVRIADLPDSTLAWMMPALSGVEGGSTIWLDADAAGQGWFVDQTPFLSEEFVSGPSFVNSHSSFDSDNSTLGATPWQLQAASGSDAYGHIDLLTTVLHEMGHVLGYGDETITLRPGSGQALMTETLPVGVRRLPSALDVGVSSQRDERDLRDDLASPAFPHVTPVSPISPFTPHQDLIGQLLRGEQESFAGVWGAIETGQGPSSRPEAVLPRIEWGDDEERVDLTESITLKTTTVKPSWLSRFLFYTGREAVKPQDHGIEVVLPGRKK
ncbi:MAG: putative Ig domain-containing protein [Nitrospira sp.]|nr:putative Ig domain-containing protein [Nitrospira sp.]